VLVNLLKEFYRAHSEFKFTKQFHLEVTIPRFTLSTCAIVQRKCPITTEWPF